MVEPKGGDGFTVDVSQVDHVRHLGQTEVLLQLVDQPLLLSQARGGQGGEVYT